MSLRTEFESRGIVRGGTLILPPADALEMVDRARELDIAVLGIDGFWITEDSTQPDMGHSIDLGDAAQHSWSRAREFISDRTDLGLMFEVVVDDLRSPGAWRVG